MGYVFKEAEYTDKEKVRVAFSYVTKKDKSKLVIVTHPDNMMILYLPAGASILQELANDIEKRGVKIPGLNDEMAHYRMEGTSYFLSTSYEGKKLTTISLSTFTDPPPQLVKGESADHVRFADADGKFHYMSEFKGKVVYINMWASWCSYCLAAVPEVKKMINQLKPDERKNVVFLFLNGEKEQTPWLSAVRRYEYDKYGLNFQIPTKPFGNPKIAFVLRAYPSYTIIDKQGRLWKNWAEKPGPQAIAEIRKLINQ